MGVYAPSISSNSAAATVLTSETTTSTAYADLTTTTDTVTVTIGASGLASVSIFSYMLNTVTFGENLVGVAVSGANTVAVNDNMAIMYQAFTANAETQYGATFLYTGLTPGSTTFKMKYRVTAGTGSFKYRRIAVIPL